jgi:haloalkane dehalogenase
MTTRHPAGERPSWVDDELFPFESRFMEIDGHTVHYVDEGSGPALLLLHGNPTWSFEYCDLIQALREEFRCVALDYPGFGLSSPRPGYRFLPEEHAQVVTAFVDSLALSDVTLVVHDWGGPIGLATVQQRPAAFEALVLANTWAWPIGDLHIRALSHLFGNPLGRLLVRQFNLFVNAMIPVGRRLRKPTAAEMAHYRQPPFAPDASAVLPGRIIASRDFLADVEARIPDLASLPTLIVWGDADFAFRAKERRRWEQAFADHHTVIIEGAGHFVQSDAPEEFAAAIRDWRFAPGGQRTPPARGDIQRKAPEES